jgi:ABC-type Fe3+ transport system substrate-binding protein
MVSSGAKMKRLLRILASFALVSGLTSNVIAAQWSAPLASVIKDANKEGKLKLLWGEGTLGGGKGAAKFEVMMNQMFGTSIKISFTPGAAMPQVGSQIAAEFAAGQSSASDVYIGADSYLTPLVKRKIFHAVEWPKFLPGRITTEMVEGEHTSLRVYTGIPGIPYNTKLTPKNEVPKTLKDMLKPFWKGKIASTPYVTSLNLLASKEMWGKEAALDYIRQLSKQATGLIRCNEIDRVASGEFLAFVMDCSGSQTFEAQAHGAPVEHVIAADGAMLRHRMLAIPKNAEHPAAAKLFTTFMLTKEAQKQLWESDFSDMYLFPESHMGERVRAAQKRGVKFFVPTLEWVAANPEIDAISEEMVKIMTQK